MINVYAGGSDPFDRYGHCEQIFTLFFVSREISTLGQCTVAPQGDPDAHSLHDTSHMHPPPALRPREAAARTPGRRYASVHTVPIRRTIGAKKQPARTPLPAATGRTTTHESVLCGYGCGPGVGAAAVDALGVGWDRLEAPAGRSEGRREGRRSRHIVRMRPKGAEFEARGLLRTFQRGPAAAQWAMAGEAPAPRLNDRSRPRPQGGSGSERIAASDRT